jgi:hypothetical protein
MGSVCARIISSYQYWTMSAFLGQLPSTINRRAPPAMEVLLGWNMDGRDAVTADSVYTPVPASR